MASQFAYVLEQFGDPKEVVKLKSVPKPEITKDTDVLIKVKAAAVHPHDFSMIRGYWGVKPALPAPVGSEASGVIEAVGKGVQGLHVGQRVHYIDIPGAAWSEYVVAHYQKLVPVPDSLTFEEAAQLTVNPISAFGVFDVLGIQKGQFLIQTAAGSSIGRIVIQFAKERGIKTINIVRRDDQIEELKALGADYVINSEKENLKERIAAIAGAEARFAIDCVNGELGARLVDSLASNGLVVNYGAASREPYNFSIGNSIFKNITIKTFWAPLWTSANLHKLPALYAELFGYLGNKKFSLASKTFDAKTQFAEALAHTQVPGKAEKTILLF